MTTNLIPNGNVTKPAEFCSMHVAYPFVGVAPSNLTLGNVRTLEYGSTVPGVAGTRWYNIELTQGVYTWSALDTFITYYRGLGATVSFQIFGTPSWYTSITTNDSAGHTGGYAYPDLDTNLVATQAFVTALITRYNTSGGAWQIANPTLGKGIKILMPVNEPQFLNATFTGVATGTTALTISNLQVGSTPIAAQMFLESSGAAISPGLHIVSGSGTSWTMNAAATFNETVTGVGTGSNNFWWGTQTQTVDFCNAVYLAAKAVDSTVEVTSPSFTNPVSYAQPWLNTFGTQYPTVKGSSTFDTLDFHAYWVSAYGKPYATFTNDIIGGTCGVQAYQNLSALYCGGKPVSMSEFGFDATSTNNLISFLNETPLFRFTTLLQCMAASAALGLKRFGCFRYVNFGSTDGTSALCGVFYVSGLTINGVSYPVDANGVVLAFNTMAGVAGKTTTNPSFAQIGGLVNLTFTDSTQLVV